jgi:hypothetical protein
MQERHAPIKGLGAFWPTPLFTNCRWPQTHARRRWLFFTAGRSSSSFLGKVSWLKGAPLLGSP